jgi:Tfp pilus assembly protein FimT
VTRYRPRALGRAAVAAAMVFPALAIVATAAGARSTDGVYVDRRWNAFAGTTNVQAARLALDARARTAYVLESGDGEVRVRAWDLDRFKPRTPVLVERDAPALTAATPLAVDDRHSVLVTAPAPAPGVVPAVRAYTVRGRALAVAASAPSRFPAGYAVLGLAVDTARDRLIVMGGPSGSGGVQLVGAGVGGVLVDLWSLKDLARGVVTAEHAQPLRVPQTCGQLVTSTYQAAVLPAPDGKSLFFGCLSNRGLTTPLGPNAGDVSGVAELILAAAGTGAPSALRLFPVSGNFATGDSLVARGSRRVVLVANSATATNFRVFDSRSRYYVGNVGLDDIGVSALGVDDGSSRGYYVIAGGLGVFDAGATPATQGVVYDELAPILGVLRRPIDVDPVTRRLFIVTADDLNGGSDPFVAVVKDNSEVNVDRGGSDEEPGVDEPEVPGRTASSRTADSGAVGAEFRLVGGPSALLFNSTHFDSRAIVARAGTRWEQFAIARGVRLSGDEASAEAVTTRQDAATSADMAVTVKELGVDVQPAPFAAPALCADLGYSPTIAADDSATVSCDVTKQLASAEVEAQPARILMTRAGHPDAVPAPVQVKDADASVDVHRDGPLGKVVTTLRSEADGIDILGAVQIGRVVAKAVVTTHGRPGTAATSYERSVSGLVVNGVEVCDTTCSTAQVHAVVDEVFGGRVRVAFPEPERYAAPNGTVARLTDNRYRHVERTQFDDVPEDSVLTPAMEVVVYLDGTSTSRLVVSLASVSGQQRYRIYRLGPDATPPPPLPSALPTAVRPPVLDPEDPLGGGSVPTLTDPLVKHPLAAPPTPADLVRRLRDGLKVVMRSPGQLAGVVALWTLLALPVYLSARRRLLLDLPFLRRSLEES